jgi:metacaspase-1
MKAALCIGINNFSDARVTPLAGCVNDAADWAEALAAQHYIALTLTDGNATRDAIMAELLKLRNLAIAAQLDTIAITFSSHGTQVLDVNGDESDGLDEATCPHDVRAGADGWEHVITDDEWRAWFDSVPPHVRVLAYFDVCHSGTMHRRLSSRTLTPRFLPPFVHQPAPPRRRSFAANRKRSCDPTRIVYGACEAGDVAMDAVVNGRPQGAGTAAALRTMPELAGPVPWTACRTWLTNQRRWLAANGYRQMPQMEAW